MIISGNDVKLNIFWNDKVYESLTFSEVEELFKEYKDGICELKPQEMMSIPDCYAIFCEDNSNNKFECKIYKTLYDKDIWTMLMKDNYEGYALYQNPKTGKYEISWYHTKLTKPLDKKEEEKMITCYIPKQK